MSATRPSWLGEDVQREDVSSHAVSRVQALMKTPWKKPGRWPLLTKGGQKRWHLGYRDHEGVVRSRAFATQQDATAWKKAYVEAERHSRLREFLLGTDAPELRSDDTPLREVVLDWIARDAHPENLGGLAPQTYHSYRSIASRHIFGNPTRNSKGQVVAAGVSYGIGHLPVAEFSMTVHLKVWLRAMRAAGVGPQLELRAWAVLSAALSWAVEEPEYPIEVNGCALMQRKRAQRRASRRAGTGAEPAGSLGKRRSSLQCWALAPQAVERIRHVMLERRERRSALLALRDATVVSLQYQLGCRNQEVWALRLADIEGKRAHIVEVLSYGELDAGKTATSIDRRPPISRLLRDDLDHWLEALNCAGYSMDPDAFLFPGSLGGAHHGHPKGHMTNSQAKKWGPNFFNPAVDAIAERWPKLSAVRGATPYALRRGGISLRLRAGEDRQQVADECGTSVAMLDRHYSFALEDLRDLGPRSAENELRAARRAVFGTSLRAAA